MIYTLMHRQLPVADLEYDEGSTAFSKILSVWNLEHFPVGIVGKGIIDRLALNQWWRGRTIPASRSGLKDALRALDVISPETLLEKCYGLSLSDQYWVCPAGSEITWESINFFDHPFSKDVGEVLFGQLPDGKIDLLSPDNSSDGWLRKKWVIQNGKRLLMKGGSGTLQQEPYNEVFATTLMERMGIPCVKYELVFQDGKPYSICEDFVSRDVDLISAHRLIQTEKQRKDLSDLQHFRNCCKNNGISDYDIFLAQMIAVDYLIVNGDRHYNNFGAVRDAQTLKYIGMAPLFDSGSSLWYDVPTAGIDPESEALFAKPFKRTQNVQISLVSDYSWMPKDALYSIGDELMEILRYADTIDQHRKDVLCNAVQRRAKMLEAIMKKRIKDYDLSL